jgi:hypothetical protein
MALGSRPWLGLVCTYSFTNLQTQSFEKWDCHSRLYLVSSSGSIGAHNWLPPWLTTPVQLAGVGFGYRVWSVTSTGHSSGQNDFNGFTGPLLVTAPGLSPLAQSADFEHLHYLPPHHSLKKENLDNQRDSVACSPTCLRGSSPPAHVRVAANLHHRGKSVQSASDTPQTPGLRVKVKPAS